MYYLPTNVARLEVSSGYFNRQVSLWRDVSRAAKEAQAKVNSAVQTVVAENEGDATDAFASSMRASDSSIAGLERISAAAAKMADCLASVGEVYLNGKAEMDSCYLRGMAEAHLISATVVAGPFAAYLVHKRIEQLKADLRAIEAHVKSAIESAKGALDIPEPLVEDSDTAEAYGKVPQEIVEAWEKLSDEDRRAVLQAMADDWARRNGLEPKPIVFESNARGHWDPNTQTLHISPDYVSNPGVLHTVAHESRHGLQFSMIDRYNNMTEQQRQDIRDGKAPDPFVQFDSNMAEVERLRRNYEGYGYQTDPWDAYFYQPFEHDARRVGTQFVDGMTLYELEQYKKKAGVG
ncbi:hypothetical protein [Tessaracoccus sp. OH4464_COT-324]|uniref:hypothetical protein n=1 Tax=Tessaracoccus sp. OH4464_COT-324 TaxID=2491059 RepID=UPI000F63FA93|nr:hypothetical protein [Tessaracoccus sp. OH4464_COT-324]RRD45612.1 hypothetical protein EII42_10960 [Tessaracoccus sp. OH4464_COT-324]